MMKVSRMIETLQTLNPDEEILVIWYDKSEADTYAEEQFEYHSQQPLTDEEWETIVNSLGTDYIWEVASNYFKDSMADLEEKRYKQVGLQN